MDLFQKKENKMKPQQKVVLMILIASLIILSNLNAYALDTPKTIAERYTLVDSISGYLITYYKYESDIKQFDVEDYWQTAEEMIKNKRGDCEDFAILVQAILKELDIESQLIGLWWEEKDFTTTYKWYAHMIVVFQDENDKYSFMDNQIYIASEKETIEELFEFFTDNWYEYVVYNSDGTEIETVRNENWIDEGQENKETKSVDVIYLNEK